MPDFAAPAEFPRPAAIQKFVSILIDLFLVLITRDRSITRSFSSTM